MLLSKTSLQTDQSNSLCRGTFGILVSSTLLAAWAAMWISTCDRGPMRGPAARPGIVTRPDRSRSLPPCPLPAFVVPPPLFLLTTSTSDSAPESFLSRLCHRPSPLLRLRNLAATVREEVSTSGGRLVASPHSSHPFFLWSQSSFVVTLHDASVWSTPLLLRLSTLLL